MILPFRSVCVSVFTHTLFSPLSLSIFLIHTYILCIFSPAHPYKHIYLKEEKLMPSYNTKKKPIPTHQWRIRIRSQTLSELLTQHFWRYLISFLVRVLLQHCAVSPSLRFKLRGHLFYIRPSAVTTWLNWENYLRIYIFSDLWEIKDPTTRSFPNSSKLVRQIYWPSTLYSDYR